MRKILSGHVCDTDTANRCAVSADGERILYRSKGGYYFIYENDNVTPPKMLLVTAETAENFRKHYQPDAAPLTQPKEGKVTRTFRLSASASAALDEMAEREGKSITAMLEALILGAK